MNQYVIYKRPEDYPTKFVVRLWIIGPGTVQAGPMICTADTIEEARESLPDGVHHFDYDDPDPVIAEVWF
jgi:hypothetical protein